MTNITLETIRIIILLSPGIFGAFLLETYNSDGQKEFSNKKFYTYVLIITFFSYFFSSIVYYWVLFIIEVKKIEIARYIFLAFFLLIIVSMFYYIKKIEKLSYKKMGIGILFIIFFVLLPSFNSVKEIKFMEVDKNPILILAKGDFLKFDLFYILFAILVAVYVIMLSILFFENFIFEIKNKNSYVKLIPSLISGIFKGEVKVEPFNELKKKKVRICWFKYNQTYLGNVEGFKQLNEDKFEFILKNVLILNSNNGITKNKYVEYVVLPLTRGEFYLEYPQKQRQIKKIKNIFPTRDRVIIISTNKYLKH
ncbi:hypothetical protein [Fusobacterium varium]|uniref:hypothetical protein n=1 Tax=Fusobacterium varium TaxID=856 RepID=UPI000E407F88|nr:hypothetical protein [Fusobacterium varium]RGJ31230.1 hypothetical protein DXD66_02580 [Fusobacterium varium]